MTERRRLDESITATRTIERDLADTRELIELAEMEGDEALADDGVAALQALAAKAEMDKVAALLSGEEIIVKDGADAAQVESAGGTGCEADPDFLGIHAAKIGKKRQGRALTAASHQFRYLWICSI